MGSLAAVGLGARMALEEYPGYRLVQRLRDGEGLERILAERLRTLADWLSPPRQPSRDLERIKERLGAKPRKTQFEKKRQSSLPPRAKLFAHPSDDPRIRVEIKSKVVHVQHNSGSVGVRYVGEKKGEMRTLVRASGRWIEFSALEPDLELTKDEADWILRHRKDFVRRQ